MLIRTRASLLDDRTYSLDSSSLHIGIRDVLLSFSEEIPVCKVWNIRVIRCHGASIIESPECDLRPLVSESPLPSNIPPLLDSEQPAERRGGTYLLQSAQVLPVVGKIGIVHLGFQPRNTGSDFWTPTAELYYRRFAEHRVGRRRWYQCQCEEVFDALFETCKVSQWRDSPGCILGEESGRYG